MLIHIGYHKTGTTHLQKHVFDDPEIGFFQPCARRDIIQKIVLVPPFRFDPLSTRRYFDEQSADHCGHGKEPVLSAERLSGNPHSGGYDSEVILDRLHQTFPDAKVLICFREQRRMLASIYHQYVREGGALSLDRYVSPPSQGEARLPMFSWTFLEYDRLIAAYRERFGAEKVLALPYEWFQKHPMGFMQWVTSFSGGLSPNYRQRRYVNASISPFAMWLKRPINFFLVRDRLNPLGLSEKTWVSSVCRRGAEKIDNAVPPAIRRLSKRHREAKIASLVGERYRESNRRLKEMLSVDIEGLGYDL